MIKSLTYKVKSSALQFAIFISVLIALLLGGLILYVYTFVFLKEQSKAAIENIQLADSALNYILNQPNSTSDTIRISYLEQDHQIAKGSVSNWGVFQIASARMEHRKKVFVKSAIIGSRIYSATSPTLYLQEMYNPLSVVGKTKIKGVAYLPMQGVKPGYIAGQSYYGSQLIYGVTKKSGSLPKMDKKIWGQIQFYAQDFKPTLNQFSIFNCANQKISNSFKKPTRYYISSKPILLEKTQLTGNIIVKSDTLIKVKKSALLRDVILIAPVVEIEDGVAGVFQSIANRNIKVGKDCQLAYPSALVLFQDNKKELVSKSSRPFSDQIFIDTGSIIKGYVCYFQTQVLPDFKTQLILEKEAKIKGQVYCQGNFELKGAVSGCVYTKQFISNTAGSIFVNHILDGVIENENIPDIYGGILFERDKKTILKWLY